MSLEEYNRQRAALLRQQAQVAKSIREHRTIEVVDGKQHRIDPCVAMKILTALEHPKHRDARTT